MLGIQHFSPIRNAMRIFSAERSPRQIAGAIALGTLIGILPKGNLVAVAFSVILFSLRVNLGVGLTVVFLVSLASPQIAPLAHGIGVRAFQSPSVYQSIQRVYDWPLVPWTDLNNTVVLGSAVLGLILLYPVYHVSHAVVAKVQPAWRRWRAGEAVLQASETTHSGHGQPSPPVAHPSVAETVAADVSLRAAQRDFISDAPAQQTGLAANTEPHHPAPTVNVTPSAVEQQRTDGQRVTPVVAETAIVRPAAVLPNDRAAVDEQADDSLELSQPESPIHARRTADLSDAELRQGPIGPKLLRAIEEGRRALERRPLQFAEPPHAPELTTSASELTSNDQTAGASVEIEAANVDETIEAKRQPTPLFTRKPAAGSAPESNRRDVA